MVDIVGHSRFATAGALCNIHHIARSVLHQIGEDHRIARYAQEASTSHGPSIRPPMSSTPSRCSPFEVEGEGEAEGELIAEVVLEMVGQVMVQTMTTI